MTKGRGRNVGVWLSLEDYEWLQSEATKHSVTVSALLRAMIVDAREEFNDLQRGSAPRCERSGEAGKADGSAAPGDHQDDNGHSSRKEVGL